MEVKETNINSMIEEELEVQTDDSGFITPKNYSYILAYYVSIFKKIKDQVNIATIIDRLIDKDQFEIQIYYDRNSIFNHCDSSCSRCHKPAPVNSTFCPNCNMIKLLYTKSDLHTLLSKIDRGHANYNINVDGIFIYKKQYEIITSSFAKLIKSRLIEIYKK